MYHNICSQSNLIDRGLNNKEYFLRLNIMDKYILHEKTVLITGGALRVGRILSIAAAEAGANVIIHYSRSKNEADRLVKEILLFNVKCQAVQQDFTCLEEIGSFFDRCQDIAPVDILVNNAAYFKPLTIDTTSLNDWREHMAVNLDAPFLLSQRFMELLPPEKKGRIINILDWRALRPGKDHLPYTISKAGLAAFTKSMALAAAPQILVNGIALGAMLPPADGVNEEKLFSEYPIQRWITPEELAQTFYFLAAGPDIITGEIIHLDGGRHLQ